MFHRQCHSCSSWCLELNDIIDTCHTESAENNWERYSTIFLQELGSYFPLLQWFVNVSSSGENWHIACQLCSVAPWRPMIHCWVMQHELWGLFNCSWMRYRTEMCYIFSSLVYTVKGKWKEVSETSGGQVQGVSVGWGKKKKLFTFSSLGLEKKYLQFTRGTIMIQVQSVSVLFPVAKYWLCFIAADGQNGECRLCWKEWVSVRATSGPSCAQWTWLLHQAASLELAGALGAFCHSSHCSSAPHQIPHLPPCQDWRTI